MVTIETYTMHGKCYAVFIIRYGYNPEVYIFLN